MLSLTIQLIELTQRHTSRMIALPRTVASYLADLTILKQLLSDVQNSLALPPTTTSTWVVTQSALTNELQTIQSELESIQDKLHRAQNEPLFTARKVLWPFSEDETGKWASKLRNCRGRIESVVSTSTLYGSSLITVLLAVVLTDISRRLQLQALSEIQELINKTETTEQG